MKILIEASGSLVAASLILSLKKINIEVIATDINPWNSGAALSDKYIKLPKFTNPDLWTTIKKIILENNVNHIIPSFDEMLLGWSNFNKKFNCNMDILLSPTQTIETFTDKWLTYEAFKNLSIPTPETSLEKKYSLIKPIKGRGSKGVKIIQEDIDMKGLISQEIVKGEEITIDCLFDKNGIPIYIVPRLRLKTIEGKSVISETVKHDLAEKLVKKLAKEFFFIGPVNIQCFVENDNIWFIEVNPRIAGGMILGFEATENWFDLWFNRICHDKSFTPKPIKYGLRMDRYYSEIYTQINEI